MTEETLFYLALEQTAGDRPAFLAQACGSNDAMRQRVERLLNAHAHPGSFLAQSPAAAVATLATATSVEGPGSRLGPFTLLERIGEGGMGVVFLAEQREPIARKVALKVIKPGMDSRQVIARFEAERQALARMEHANIARVLDAGASSSGRPYFVMELCRGVPITDYCDQHGLDMPQRLRLFVTVCQAVQHAHLKGIIHRDLKPSNVLVSEDSDGNAASGDAVVKVIDFGIAKALGSEVTDSAIQTSAAQLLGTPLYMSPEQAEMAGDVDTRSDIYSLGILLYEMLTGVTPFDRERLRVASFDEVRRIIRQEEPPRPSTRLSTLGQAATTVSARRQSDPRRLSGLLRGELDWIVLKALEKDRNRRYETASAFADDVQRYLRDEAVTACPPSAWYRLRKFARRKRGALTMALVVAVALIVGTAAVGGSIGWVLSDQAAREAALDQEVDRTLTEAVTLIDGARWPEAGAAADRADKLLAAAGRAETPPRLRELQKDLGMVQRLEDLYSQPPSADRTLDAVTRFQALTNQESDPAYVQAFKDYGIDLTVLSVAEAAQALRARTIWRELAGAVDLWSSIRRNAGKPASPDWQHLLAIARAVDPDPIRNKLRDAIGSRDRKGMVALAVSADVTQLPPRTLLLLGNALRDLNEFDQALILLRKAQTQYPGDLWLNDALGWCCYTKYPTASDEAVLYFTAALALRPGRWQTWCKRGLAYRRLQQPAKSVADLSRAIELNKTNGLLWHYRAFAHADRREWETVIRDSTQALKLDPTLPGAYYYRAMAHANLKQWERAIADYTETLKLPTFGLEIAWHGRGACYAALGQWAQAAHDLDKAAQMRFGDNSWFLELACYRAAAGDREAHRRATAHLFLLRGRTKDPIVAHRVALSCLLLPEPAGDVKALAQLAAFGAAGAPKDPWSVFTHGFALYRTGDHAQAVVQLECLDMSWSKAAASDGGPVATWLVLAMAQQHLGHGEQAKQWLRKATERMDQETTVATIGPLRLQSQVWALCLVLRGEAESILKTRD